MSDYYLWFKFAHVIIAIVAIGSSATLAILLEFFGSHPAHGAYVLRAVRRLLYCIVIPGYVLMLVTGMWMGHLASLLDAHWTEAAMNIWGFGALFFAGFAVMLHRQIRLFESAGPASATYKRVALTGRLMGGGAGLVIVTILYFMVFKPAS
jgi:uncharacterized membrane protein